MSKTHLDRMGWITDSIFRASGIRQCLYKKVQAARDLVYRLGHAVAGAGVNGLLKVTSSVPTNVCGVPYTWFEHVIRFNIEFLLRTTSAVWEGI